MEKKKLFQGCSAWFSSSVAEKKIKLWKVYGGTLDTVNFAQYIFSEDIDAKDTVSIFESEAYMDEHMAVFNADYIIDCVKKKNRASVPVGKYHLVPRGIEEDVRNAISGLDWEEDDEQHEQGLGKNKKRLSKKSLSAVKTGAGNLSNNLKSKESLVISDFVHIDDLPKVTGKLEELKPGENGCTVILI